MRGISALLMAVAATGCMQQLPKLNIGAGVSTVIPTEEALRPTYQVDFFARVDVAALQVEGVLGWKVYEYGETGLNEAADLTVLPFAITARYASGTGAARFVVGGGLVWNVNEIDEIGDIEGVDDSIGYRIVAGVDLKIVEDLKMGAEVQYDFSKTDVETLADPDVSVDTGGLVGRITIAYRF